MGCIKCGRDIPDGAMFCPWCGKKQVQEKRKALKRANGTGTVYKLSGRRSRPWVAAKNKMVIGYYAKKTEAMEAIERLAGRSISERYNMTFEEVFQEWKAEHFREIGEKSIAAYENAYAKSKELYGRQFRSLRVKDFQSIIDNNKAAKSRSAQAKYKHLFVQLSEWAVREEAATTNYARFVKLDGEKPKEKAVFTDSDIKKMEAAGTPAAKLTLMLIYTGMRIGEMFSLPLSGYHETYVIGGEKTEAGRNRIIPICPEGRAYFAEIAARADGDLLISGYDGQKVAENFRKRDYYPMLEQLGIEKKPPHATRHTFASWAVSAGIRPEMLQKILGHSNYDTTADIYVHANIDQLVEAVEAH